MANQAPMMADDSPHLANEEHDAPPANPAAVETTSVSAAPLDADDPQPDVDAAEITMPLSTSTTATSTTTTHTSSGGYLTPAGSSSKIQLDPNEETLLMVLYLRVRDAASERPILGDVYASNVINRVDCDFSRSLFTLEPSYIPYIAGRAKKLDDWTRDFLLSAADDDDEVLVLHLACGLDSRNLRVGRGPRVQWVDVDRPQVVGLRQRLVPTPPGDYQLLAAQVTEEGDDECGDDSSWLAGLPTHKRTLVVMEGLTMYLSPEEGRRLFRRLLARFPHGHVVFDTIGSLTAHFTSMLKAFRSTGARVRWGVDDAREIEGMDDTGRLRLVESVALYDHMNTGFLGKNYPPLFGGWTWALSMLPSFKKNGHFWHFEF